MRSKYLALSLALLPISGFSEVVTDTKISTSTGVGIGVTREEAVDRAVLEAIGKLEGVKLKAQTLSVSTSIKTNESNQFGAIYNSTIEKATNGKVDSYSILNVTENGRGGYEAQVEIKKVKTTQHYKAEGLSPDSRRKVAVMPFHLTGSDPSVKTEVSRQLTQDLVSYLTQTRRFAVVDREHVDEIAKEKGLILSKDLRTEEHFKLGQALGADYLIVGNISNASLQDSLENNRLTGQKIRKLKSSISIDYRIILMATRQIKWSDSVHISEETSLTGNNDLDAPSNFIRSSIEKGAQKIISQLTNNIYPARIVQLQPMDQQVVINQGGNSMQEGDKYEVFREGKAIIDPYTKEPLGKDETRIAEIEIIRVSPKMTYARIVSGNISGIKEQDICRPLSSANTEEAKQVASVGRKSNITMDEGGGVKLPFD